MVPLFKRLTFLQYSEVFRNSSDNTVIYCGVHFWKLSPFLWLESWEWCLGSGDLFFHHCWLISAVGTKQICKTPSLSSVFLWLAYWSKQHLFSYRTVQTAVQTYFCRTGVLSSSFLTNTFNKWMCRIQVPKSVIHVICKIRCRVLANTVKLHN